MTSNNISSLKSYQTFILRIWVEEHAKEQRVLLLDASTGERWLFSNFQALLVHFEQKTDKEM